MCSAHNKAGHYPAVPAIYSKNTLSVSYTMFATKYYNYIFVFIYYFPSPKNIELDLIDNACVIESNYQGKHIIK